jgi:hypothetical protein
LVTVPAAIYIIFQHLIASVVKSRLMARFSGTIESNPTLRAIGLPVPVPVPVMQAAVGGQGSERTRV